MCKTYSYGDKNMNKNNVNGTQKNRAYFIDNSVDKEYKDYKETLKSYYA